MTDDRISYSPRQAAEVTGVPLDRLRRVILSGELRVHYVSPKRCVILRRDLEQWIEDAPTERPNV